MLMLLTSKQEVWQWLYGPMFSAVTLDAWYNDEPLTGANRRDGESEFVLYQNKIVGAIRLRY